MLIAGFPAGSFQANCYVLAPEPGGGALVVDPGEQAMERLEQVLATHQLRPGAILLTHGHLDHCADAAAFARQHDIPTYLHPADEHLLDDPLSGLSGQLRQALSGMDLTGLRPPTVLDPDTRLEVAGLTLTVDHTPGHTRGSVVFRLGAQDERADVLFTGDTLFAGSIGRTDLPGGNHAEIEHSLAGMLARYADAAHVLPGHGPTSTIGQERRSNPFLTRLQPSAAS